MANYKCFNCEKIIKEEYIKKKIRCPYCGSKMLFKARTATTTVKKQPLISKLPKTRRNWQSLHQTATEKQSKMHQVAAIR